MCFHVINGSGPSCHSWLLHVFTLSGALCSSSDSSILKLQQYQYEMSGFLSFSYFGPYLWNSVPFDLRHCSALSFFKTMLNSFLFSQCICPQLSSDLYGCNPHGHNRAQKRVLILAHSEGDNWYVSGLIKLSFCFFSLIIAMWLHFCIIISFISFLHVWVALTVTSER